ncbi:serine/threonine-protein kinase [Nonomuraea sp. NPDC049309]|uniref:serine/threonine-protein kinase n=1 Tax=Nonomuraea sp. NPDC049309 TaxID=3364350 RepID=UPI003719F058
MTSGTSSTHAQDMLGPYRVLRKIGEGGMGVAHLGIDPAGRHVAIKVLHPHVAADLKARDRLIREVETMRRVRSRYVAEVIDAQIAGGRPYVVTRFANGRTLEDTVLSDGPLEPHEVVRLARGLCQALVDIHAAGVIHRDLKPSNVMLVDGEPLVIDFGIAQLVDSARLTQTGMFVGTPGYLAPEIIRESLVTQAADVHALASTVFFAATGLPPFGTGTFESVCFNTMEGRWQSEHAPGWLRGWLTRALDVDPAARPTARELARMAAALDPDARRPAGVAAYDRTLTMPASEDAVSDLLPPVTYATSVHERAHPATAAAPTVHDDKPEPPRPAPPREPFELRRFLKSSDFSGVLVLVMLASITVLRPVTIGLIAAGLSVALRIAGHYLDDEREDLTRAALVTVGHLLLSLASGIVAGTLLHMTGRLNASHAESLAAGLFTIGLFALPGAGKVRRVASAGLARVLPGQSAVIVNTAILGPIALITVIAALGQGL